MIDAIQLPQVIAQAHAAAREATQKCIDTNPGQWYPCGFAWVTVQEKGSTKLGRALLKQGFSKAYEGGLKIWNPSEHPTQWMDAKVEGARAFAEVLRAHGIAATVGERMD